MTLKSALVVLLLSGAAAMPALAEYPDHPIAFINPNSAGGGTDVGIRTWAPYVEKCVGNGAAFAVTAMPGATGAVGMSEAAKAPHDGYTMASLNMPQLVTNQIAKQMTFTTDSFDYLGNIVGVRSVIAVRPDSKFKTLADFVAFAKQSGAPINVGLGGLGADDHLGGLRFEEMIGVDFNFIPFGSGADSRNALLGNQVEIAFMSNSEAAQFRDEIRPLAIASVQRDPLYPDTPTFKEQGYDLISGSDHVIGLPKGAPEEVKTKLADCIAKAAADPAFLADAKKRSLSLNIMDAKQTETFVHDQENIFRELWKTNPWISK
ncbi:tripartite tricarboxylate transporter substrate binding protein [Sinorhizobium mexicanum]|uniref:Tripartite tricarboxylate transporter substrate binding protein n=1 Tax=Sinorhizobium mexicanum TaxID=375549 RepID=A0A859QE81_9HYPH|nr:tripartite tricarboxylate transporter substrate binding protein [Sinorhizobium mexicanum]MBP1888183.1 tripartite-type tricarboxylate transporter receptor subunit TctC [Sinorhizobium mexicanum]QLL62972.1 tripartite tricarboxylate transporter substrate binding protein [Sinorhizobium mexicanum]